MVEPEAKMGLQFSVYPLRQPHLAPGVGDAVKAAADAGLEVSIGNLSTFASGDEESVFRALRAAWRAAAALGPTVMVATLSSGLPDGNTIARLQSATET